jgi:hypothetical protein
MCDVMDDLCNQIECLVVNSKMINDIDTIITEINYYDSYNIDIYEVCVSCGHSLTWDLEYTLTQADIKWLNHFGKNYFFTKLNEVKLIDTPEKYRSVNNIYDELLQLFSLQIEN